MNCTWRNKIKTQQVSRGLEDRLVINRRGPKGKTGQGDIKEVPWSIQATVYDKNTIY